MKRRRVGFVVIGIASSELAIAFNLFMSAEAGGQIAPPAVTAAQSWAAAEPVDIKSIPVVADSVDCPPGTYWSLQLADQPPLPFCPFSGLQTMKITNDVYVIDDRGVDYPGLWMQQAAGGPTGAKLQGRVSVIEAGRNASVGAFSFSSGQLWLEISGVSSNRALSYLVIHTPEPGGVYDLFLTTNLSFNVSGLNGTNWLWIARNGPGQTNLTITNFITAQCFFRLGTTNDAEGDGLTDAFEQLVSHTDPNNGDQNANGIPDGWEWFNFGDLNQPADGDYDGDGLSNYDEYQLGSEPNTISFDVSFDNFNINSDVAVGTFFVFTGVPAKMAVLVGNTNFAAASWAAYNPTIPVNLGSTDGSKIVWIGLKGRADSSAATWEKMPLSRDRSPPLIVVTNPAVTTVATPLFQLQGYCPEPLSSLRYDVTNVAGSRLDLVGAVTRQWFDTNLFDLTTNWFECSDIRLTNGLNRIILRSTDRAGNQSTNIYSYVLDYSTATNQPVLKLFWPQTGFEICGDHFDWRGWVDDPSATISGWIVATNGVTNVFSGKVERNGNFWAENLPLADGTNSLTLAVTNSAGRGCLTNISVSRSDMVLIMNPVTDDLWQPGVSVTGYVGDASYSVWVNGVKATVSPDGTWSAANVPVTEGGTASFKITAYAPGEQQPSGGGP